MIFLILNCLKGTTICHNILKKNWKTSNLEKILSLFWTLQEKKLPNGTSQKKGISGTNNTDLNVQKKNLKNQKLNVFVFNAGKNFLRRVIEEITANIVQENVRQNIGVIAELITKREFAQSVEMNIELIGSVNKKPVETNIAVYAVCSTTEKRKADVYNLTVDEEHEYFANGFLVHNCCDAVIYSCLSRPFSPMRAKMKRDSYDAWKGEDKKRSAWTY